MSDVSVEFGAKDTGLEQTLKTVQNELTRLNAEVQSGELSFSELQQAMRQVGQAEKLEAQLMAIAEATNEAGGAADGAAPQMDNAADAIDEVGDSAIDTGNKSEMGFAEMTAAVATAQIAVNAAMGVIGAAIDGVKGTFATFGEALSRGADLDILSSRTGAASEELIRLQRAFENTGASADMVGPVFDKMNRALAGGGEEGGRASAAIAKLGVDMEAIKSMSPDQQFEAIGKALSGVADRSDRAAIAMDIFGRGSGTRLLRLFEDFDGTMTGVDRQLGTMPTIMGELSSAFEASSTEINAVREKFVEFATGILSGVMPAVEAIATGLSSIDAAGLGQKLVDSFIAGTAAMEGFQSAINSFKTGDIMDALSMLWQSTKVQAMQTADNIYKNLQAAFDAVVEFGMQAFDPNGALIKTAINAFKYLGAEIVVAMAKSFSEVTNLLPDWFQAINPTVKLIDYAANGVITKLQETSTSALAELQASSKGVTGQIKAAGTSATGAFNEGLTTAKGLFENTNEEAGKLAKMQKEHAAKAKAYAETLESEVLPTQEELTAEAKRYFEEHKQFNAVIEEQNAEKLESINQQIELNEAIASGNVEEQKRIQAIIDATDQARQIAELTETIAQDTGVSAEEANRLATALVESQAAAKNTSANAGNLKANLNNAETSAKSVKKAIEDLEKEKMDGPPKSFVERLKDAREQLGKMKAFIGEDMSKMNLSDILEKLGIDTPALTNSRQQTELLEGALKAIADADVANVTPIVDEDGVNNKLEAIKGYLAGLGTVDVTPTVDESAATNSGSNAKDKIENAMDGTTAQVNTAVDETSLSSAVSKIADELGQSVDVTLNADQSIANIRSQIAEDIDLAISSSKGAGFLESIDALVDAIKTAVNNIEKKLPQKALA